MSSRQTPSHALPLLHGAPLSPGPGSYFPAACASQNAIALASIASASQSSPPSSSSSSPDTSPSSSSTPETSPCETTPLAEACSSVSEHAGSPLVVGSASASTHAASPSDETRSKAVRVAVIAGTQVAPLRSVRTSRR